MTWLRIQALHMYASMLMFINELERQGQDTSNGWKTPKRNKRREISDDQNRRKGTGGGKRSGERRGTGGEAPGWGRGRTRKEQERTQTASCLERQAGELPLRMGAEAATLGF